MIGGTIMTVTYIEALNIDIDGLLILIILLLILIFKITRKS